MTNKIVYKTEDIFKNIDSDGKQVDMVIPPEVTEKMGWKIGDTLKFSVEDGKITLTKVNEEQQDGE